ncbi:pyridoxamine 5'-phosphate oxidase-domain-containing protein [Schizophyllum fasciatum]
MSAPEWHKALQAALKSHPKSTTFQLATWDASLGRPRVRTHVSRGFITPASAPQLPLVLSTVDIRTPKVAQIASTDKVELTWWIEGTMEQFRIGGTAHVVPRPGHASGLHETFLDAVKRAPAGSALAELAKDKIDWEKRRVDTFSSLSPGMKASWCRPSPGSPLSDYPDSPPESWATAVKGLDEGDEENKKNWDEALGNFALLLIEPEDVDYVELGKKPDRRTLFKYADRRWSSTQAVP